MEVRPFTISVGEREVRDLQRRLRSTRWPGDSPEPPWVAGTDMQVLRRLVDYWRRDFDWRARVADLNQLPQVTAIVGGEPLHVLHFAGGARTPLVLTHGWPSSFVELVPLAQRLFALGHPVVVPSLPGFAFSPAPRSAPPAIPTHERWHQLMLGFGYQRYGAHGGDLGAGVTSRLAAAHPQAVIGIHLLAVAGVEHPSNLTRAEGAYLAQMDRWDREEGAYQHQQSTRPLTLAYGLSDSPVGLLAWIVEKYQSWSDCDGDVSRRFTDDQVLTQASLYWFTNTIASSFRPYFDYRSHPLGPIGRVSVPTAVAVFPHDLSQPPREYADRSYDVRRYTRFDRGGHFAAHEEPDLLADDIHTFFTDLDGDSPAPHDIRGIDVATLD